jgi:hypothetical protein
LEPATNNAQTFIHGDDTPERAADLRAENLGWACRFSRKLFAMMGAAVDASRRPGAGAIPVVPSKRLRRIDRSLDNSSVLKKNPEIAANDPRDLLLQRATMNSQNQPSL